MSNLLKQYYVTNTTGTTRIIDSNKRADVVIQEHCAAGFQPLKFSTVEDAMSVDGDTIDSDEVETDSVEVSEQIEKMLEEAQMQADDIISQAQKKAEEILLNANIKAEHIFEENKKKGYEEGSKDKLADVMKMQECVETEIKARKEQLEMEYQQKSDVLENDIVEAIIQVFNKVFHIQFDNKKEILLHLIKNTLMNVEVGKEFRIHVSQNNYKFINSHLDDIKLNIGNDVNIEVVNDASLGTEDCQIETNFGVFDCGIDMELNTLIKDIRTLCC